VQLATQDDLDRVEALLVELRKLPELRERKRGYFSRGSRAFLHFHEDAGDLYVDVRLDGAFRRMRSPAARNRPIFYHWCGEHPSRAYESPGKLTLARENCVRGGQPNLRIRTGAKN
jgi:hypothetical protein